MRMPVQLTYAGNSDRIVWLGASITADMPLGSVTLDCDHNAVLCGRRWIADQMVAISAMVGLVSTSRSWSGPTPAS